MGSISDTQKVIVSKSGQAKRLDRFDNVPLLWFPFVATQWIVCFLIYLVSHFIVHLTSTISIEGEEFLDPNKNYIFCGWHENLYPYFASFWRCPRKIAAFIDSNWHVPPILWFVNLHGCRTINKHQNQSCGASVDRMVRLMRQGYSQLIFPDGPTGPAKRLRSGVLVTAQKSNTPVVPFRMETKVEFRVVWQWDRKKICLPFGSLKVIYSPPIYITSENWNEAKSYLLKNMG